VVTNAKTPWMRVVALALVLGCGLGGRVYGFEGGTGEPNDPYRVATTEDLRLIGSDPERLKKHFILVEDIDLDPNLPGGRVFEDALIAPDDSEEVSGHGGQDFAGVLDGRGHTIRNLCIVGRPGCDAGLFGKFSGLVKDLNLESVRISGSPCGAIAGLNHRGMILRCSVTGRVSGGDYVGGLVGSLWDAMVSDCRAEVQVMGERNVGGLVGGGPGGTLIRCEAQAVVRGDSYVGGLIGNWNTCHIIESRARGLVIGRDDVGGLTGGLHGRGVILRCASNCEVVAEGTAGGLVGDGRFAQGTWITDCYARGSVAGSEAGGLMGVAVDVRILNCYAACEMTSMAPQTGALAIGGLFGEASKPWPPLVVQSFWDTEVSGLNLSAGEGTLNLAEGPGTDPMQQRATFEQAGWDFVSTWAMPEGDYPVLQWEADEDDVTEGPTRRSAAGMMR